MCDKYRDDGYGRSKARISSHSLGVYGSRYMTCIWSAYGCIWAVYEPAKTCRWFDINMFVVICDFTGMEPLRYAWCTRCSKRFVCRVGPILCTVQYTVRARQPRRSSAGQLQYSYGTAAVT